MSIVLTALLLPVIAYSFLFLSTAALTVSSASVLAYIVCLRVFSVLLRSTLLKGPSLRMENAFHVTDHNNI